MVLALVQFYRHRPNVSMRCCVLLVVFIVLPSVVQGDNLTSDSAEASETQHATCQIVTDKMVATATATVSRALRGVCTTREIDKQFLTIKHELGSQIYKIHAMLLKTNQKLAELKEMLDKNGQQQENLATNQDFKPTPRDLEIKEKNNSIHEDNITKTKVFSYYWKIEGIQNKITTKEQQTLRSPSFYVNEGYRMYIKMFPHQGKGNVYIHVGLTHGEIDDMLDWPFRLKHRITLMDQSTEADDITSQLWDPSVLCSPSDWQKPSAKDNEECVGFGFTQDTLLQNSYILDDSLVIKLDVFL